MPTMTLVDQQPLVAVRRAFMPATLTIAVTEMRLPQYLVFIFVLSMDRTMHFKVEMHKLEHLLATEINLEPVSIPFTRG